MRKLLIFLLLLLGGYMVSDAQMRYAFVDTDYILSNIPEYKVAKGKIDKMSKEWEKEIQQKRNTVDELYKQFKIDQIFLSPAMKEVKEEELAKMDAEAAELKNKYFGEKGELFKKREELIKPILDDVFDAIKDIAVSGNYGAVFDRAQGINVVYFSPKLDKSDSVLDKLGYKVKKRKRRK